jgi:saccharopine dehydrogenase-like NADP-dependent oxidoreductase
MVNRVLIIGGRGRVGSSVAADLTKHIDTQIVLSGRTSDSIARFRQNIDSRLEYQVLELADRSSLAEAIAAVDLVVHCAGPFRCRDTNVLKICIEQGVHYVDVSDDLDFTKTALSDRAEAEAAGVTAIVNTGVFPGISNSMARLGVEKLDVAEQIHFRYVVAGSGGAGVTAMRTTFLGLQHPFNAWIDGKWQQVKPYSERETVEFPPPFAKVGVYWFDLPELFTLLDSVRVNTITVKFGVFPDFYNHLTWMAARLFPPVLMRQSPVIEFLSHTSDRMTSLTDRFSGTGVAVKVEVIGKKDNRSVSYFSSIVGEDAATATGCGTGIIAELILSGKIAKPGVWTPEQILPTSLFLEAMQSRGIAIEEGLEIRD